MGEMADFYLEQIDYGYGDYDDEEDHIPTGYPMKYKTCRCCGMGHLYWREVGRKWRLFDGNKMHRCPINPLKE